MTGDQMIQMEKDCMEMAFKIVQYYTDLGVREKATIRSPLADAAVRYVAECFDVEISTKKSADRVKQSKEAWMRLFTSPKQSTKPGQRFEVGQGVKVIEADSVKCGVVLAYCNTTEGIPVYVVQVSQEMFCIAMPDDLLLLDADEQAVSKRQAELQKQHGEVVAPSEQTKAPEKKANRVYDEKLKMILIDGVARRCYVTYQTPEELKIREALIAVESMPHAHKLLTDTTIKLTEAFNTLADWNDLQEHLGGPENCI